jgi:hypothetical protein
VFGLISDVHGVHSSGWPPARHPADRFAAGQGSTGRRALVTRRSAARHPAHGAPGSSGGHGSPPGRAMTASLHSNKTLSMIRGIWSGSRSPPSRHPGVSPLLCRS